MPYSYSKVNSENARLLQALIDDAPSYTEDTESRNATILKSIINETEYNEEPQSEIEELLLELKQKISGGIVAEPLSVTENGIYTAEEGKAFTPVTVNVPLPQNAYLLKSATPSDIVTFTDGADAPLNSLKCSIEAVQAGSGTPSPTNVRAITGWSGANIIRAGINLIFKKLTGATISNNGTISTYGTASDYDLFIAHVTQGQTYTVSIDGVATAPPVMAYYTSIPTVNSQSYNQSRIVGGSSTFTAEITGYVAIRFDTGTAKVQVENGETAHAYDGNTTTITIQFGSTIYGGSLDVSKGILTVTHGMTNLGSLEYTKVENAPLGLYFFTTQGIANVIKKDYTNIIGKCERYEWVAWTGQASNTLCINAQGHLRIYPSDCQEMTGTEFATAMNNVKIIYELETPTTIQLTPTQVRSLLNNNNIYADCGSITECQYFSKEE